MQFQDRLPKSLFHFLPWLRQRRDQDDSFNASLLYFSIAKKEAERIRKSFHVGEGLNEDQVQHRLQLYGRNEIVVSDKDSLVTHLLKTCLNPVVVLLITICIISFLTGDPTGGGIIGVMAFISVFLTLFQERKSNQAAEKLKAMVRTTATALRGTKIEVPIETLVPGDLILLSAGDLVPVDVRLLNSRDLFISQAPLTGESIPVEKDSIAEPRELKKTLLELRNICFAGSNVISGVGTGIVLKTGSESYFGSIAKTITGRRETTSFEKGINSFTWLMIRFMLVMVPIVFLINGISKHDWTEAFMFAIAVAVGLTPEMLPMIVTVNLAKGALAMSKKKVIVKRLNSIQNFGAMNILCTDKTGTLTQDKVVLEKYVDATGAEEDRVLTFAFLNSFHQTGLKNLLDIAVLKHVEIQKALQIETKYKKIDEIPFDFSRRRMSVIVSEEDQKHILICKGALEEIYKVCNQIELQDKIQPLSDQVAQTSHRIARELNEDGLRVIAVAYKILPPGQSQYSVRDESDLVLLGFIAFLDPPKETAAASIEALRNKGIQIKVLTGDNEIVTRKVASQVGIPHDVILLGSDLEKLSDKELGDKTDTVSIFAKLSPAQKERIIKVLHQKGHVVGFMGDGINDSPALKAADVGISVDNAVDIAKESADIILLEKSLMVLESGVTEGRKVFGNIIKYIRMGSSSNFGNVFSVVGSSLILPFLPMLPIQLLIQNLLYDLSQTAIPLDRVDDEYVEKPRRWEINDIRRFMLYLGPVSSIFDYVTFGIMWFVFKANTPEKQSLFQTGWFVEGLLSQTLIVHMVRTAKLPFIQSRAAAPLVFTTLTIMAVGLAIPFTPFAPKLGFVPLPMNYFVWLVAILLAYGALAQIVKSHFFKKFGIQ